MNKSINADFTRRIDNLMPYVNSTHVYTPNMVGIMEIGGKFQASASTPRQPRNISNVQTQIILSCKLELFSTCKHFLFPLNYLTLCHSNTKLILD